MNATHDPFQRILSNWDAVCDQTTSPGRDPDETANLDLLDQSISRFAKKHLDEESIDAQAKLPQEVLTAAKEMGLFGITIEKPYGGSGFSLKGACRACEFLAQAERSFGVTIGLHAGLGLRGLNHFGSEQLKARYLPNLASGQDIACFAATESEAGSDLAAMKTTAIQEGQELVIQGSKIYVTNGGLASMATIVARTPDLMGSRRGHSMILIPLDRPGISRGAEEHKLGIRGSSTRSLYFEDVRVPLDHILGTPSKGLDHMNHVLSWGRILMAAGCLGLARTAFSKALQQVTTRHQFGRPIYKFGMVQQMLVNMRFRIQAMQNLLRLVACLEDEQPESIGWETSVAKVFCSESAWANADENLQLYGGSGFIKDTGVDRLLRDSRITRIFEGTNELMRHHLASAVFVTYSENPEPITGWVNSLYPDLKALGSRFETCRMDLAREISKRKKTYGLKVFQRQLDQRPLADAVIALYVMLALIANAQGESSKESLGPDVLALTEYGVQTLSKTIQSALLQLDDQAHLLVEKIAYSECDRFESKV